MTDYSKYKSLTDEEWLLLGEELNRWEAIRDDRHTRQTRLDKNESKQYGNCLSTVQAVLGRRRVRYWMNRAIEEGRSIKGNY